MGGNGAGARNALNLVATWGVHVDAGCAGATATPTPDSLLVPRPRLHLIHFHGVLAPNAKLRALVVPQEPEPAAPAVPPADCEAACVHHRPARLSWAKLLKRVFEIDLEHCPNCGGQLKIIAAILEQPVIEKILTHLGLQARAPPRAPARGAQLQAA